MIWTTVPLFYTPKKRITFRTGAGQVYSLHVEADKIESYGSSVYCYLWNNKYQGWVYEMGNVSGSVRALQHVDVIFTLFMYYCFFIIILT